ncbi:MAG: tetratricopeptide repeat protein, partial [Polyangia bacterium]
LDSERRDWAGVSIGTTPEVGRILAEAEVFVKYGLLERAADHLPRIFDIEPDHREGREKLIGVLQRLGRHEAAGRHAEILERGTRDGSPVGLVTPSLSPAGGMSLNAEAAGPEVLFDILPIDVDLGGDVGGDSGGSNQSSRSLAVKSEDRADEDRADDDRADDDRADLDPHDPAADVITPPPEIWDSGQSVDLAATDFDAEVRTADVLLASDTASDQAGLLTGVGGEASVELPDDVEFSIDESSAEEGITGEGQRQGHDNARHPHDDRRQEDSDAYGQSTPPLVRAPTVIDSSPRSSTAAGHQPAPTEEEEDPVTAFAEEVPTAVGDPDADPEVLTTAFTTSEEEELSAELEQVSFFLDQAMVDEARSLLHDLETRYPGDARVAAALRDLQARERVLNRGTGQHRVSRSSDSVATSRLAVSPTLGSTFIERPSTSSQSGGARGTPTPRAVMSGDETSDSSTHADLAIAYKGMGLLDAAIAELKLLAQDESQEVFALTTMGECFEGKSSFTEAIIRYKRALNCEQITREETLLLYFLLGAAFEHLGDVSEALYFYEKVVKRNPKFRDVDLKVAELRPRLIKRAR